MRDVIVLLCDSLRFDCVNESITPNVMEIARNGVFFTEAYAPNSATTSSMPYLLTSRPTYSADGSISYAMKKRGYRTILISSNILVSNLYGKGWDESVYHPKIVANEFLNNWSGMLEFLRGASILDRHLPPRFKSLVERLYWLRSGPRLPYAPAEDLLDIASQKIDHDPSFLWCHLMDPHHPYFPVENDYSRERIHDMNNRLLAAIHRDVLPNGGEIRKLRRLYVDNIREMDRAIGSFYDSLSDDVVLVLTSDHGEEFGEYGQLSHHHDKYIPSLQHVPLIISNHGEKGVSEERVSLSSLPQMILEITESE